MKNLLIVFLFIATSFTVNAQKKNAYADKLAKGSSEYCAKELSLNSAKQDFLYTEMYTRIVANQKEVSGKNLTKEEKQAVYKKTHKAFMKALSAEFSKDEIKQIVKLNQEYTKSLKKK